MPDGSGDPARTPCNPSGAPPLEGCPTGPVHRPRILVSASAGPHSSLEISLRATGQEEPETLPGARQPRHDRAHRYIGNPRNLLVGQALHLPELHGQCLQSLAEHLRVRAFEQYRSRIIALAAVYLFVEGGRRELVHSV